MEVGVGEDFEQFMANLLVVLLFWFLGVYADPLFDFDLILDVMDTILHGVTRFVEVFLCYQGLDNFIPRVLLQ